MAANSYIALIELNNPNRRIDATWIVQLDFALNRAPFMDELEYEDWLQLQTLCNVAKNNVNLLPDVEIPDVEIPQENADDLRMELKRILAIQASKWLELGMPGNHTEWIKAHYENVCRNGA